MPTARGNIWLRGFTLIELLVVITLIVILSVFAFANFGTFREDSNLDQATADVQTFIKAAQANATSGVLCNSGANPSIQWFVTISNNTTLNLACTYDVSGTITTWTSPKPLTISNNIQISQINVINSGGPCSGAFASTIRYGVPFGEVSYTDLCVNTSTSAFNVVLQNTRTSRTKTVVVRKGGNIDIQ